MKNTKFDAPNEYAIFLQEVIEVVRSLSVDDFDRKPHDLKGNGVIKIIDFPFFSWSEKLKKDFISATTEKLKEKNYSIDFLKKLKEQFAYELQRNEMKMGTDVFDDSNYSNIFFIIWRSENTNGVRKQMSRKVLIYIDETIKKLEQTEPAQPEPTVNVENQFSNDFEALFKFQNFLIPKVPIKDVYNHFKILTETTNKFNEFYLTNEQLYFFIKSTFIDKKPERKKFNGIPKPKKNVRKVFYEFYVKCGKYETNQTSIKRKYFNIMNDAFEGFNEKSDYNDFHKT